MFKKTISIITMAGILGFSTNSYARESFKSIDDFGKWMTFYYLNPEPTEIPDVIIYFSESPLYSSNVHVPATAFFAATFKKDVSLMTKTFDYISTQGGANARIIMVEALYQTFTPEGQELLSKAKESWFSEKQRPMLEKNILADLPTVPLEVRTNDVNLGPRDLDSLWTTFSATGDKDPIEKLISLIHLKEDGHGSEILVGAAAEWSLATNAKMHKRVLDICKEELAKSQGITKTLLERIIQKAEKTE